MCLALARVYLMISQKKSKVQKKKLTLQCAARQLLLYEGHGSGYRRLVMKPSRLAVRMSPPMIIRL